VNKHFWT